MAMTITSLKTKSITTRKATAKPIGKSEEKQRAAVEATAKARAKKNLMNANDRKARIEADKYARNVKPFSVECALCGLVLRLDQRSGGYYIGNWRKHQDHCRGYTKEAKVRNRSSQKASIGYTTDEQDLTNIPRSSSLHEYRDTYDYFSGGLCTPPSTPPSQDVSFTNGRIGASVPSAQRLYKAFHFQGCDVPMTSMILKPAEFSLERNIQGRGTMSSNAESNLRAREDILDIEGHHGDNSRKPPVLGCGGRDILNPAPIPSMEVQPVDQDMLEGASCLVALKMSSLISN